MYVEPEVEGRVTLTGEYPSPEEALSRVLPADAESHRFADVLVVRIATPCWQHDIQVRPPYMSPPDSGPVSTQEYLLENAPVQDILPILQAEFPDARFVLHPTMNGFFVRGATSELTRSIKVRMSQLDASGRPLRALPRVVLDVRHASAGQVASVIARLLPDARIRLRRSCIEVEGPPATRDTARAILKLLDEDPPKGLVQDKAARRPRRRQPRANSSSTAGQPAGMRSMRPEP